METVVVTAEKRMSDEDSYATPHLSMTKRADHVFTQVRVTCDTRDLSQRKSELKTTLRNMMRTAAGTPTISLGLRQDDLIIEMNESNFDELIEPDTRTDTSKVDVVVKSAVSQGDSFNDATHRIEAFITKVPKEGRTEILRQGRWDLTIVGPEQYRDPLVAMITADARKISDGFGPGYGVTLEGLEHQVVWYQRGPLDLALFIPYRLKVQAIGR
jgi:hypothetical protein